MAAMEFGLTDTLNTKAFNKPIEQVLFLSTIRSVYAFKLKLKTNEECFKAKYFEPLYDISIAQSRFNS